MDQNFKMGVKMNYIVKQDVKLMKFKKIPTAYAFTFSIKIKIYNTDKNLKYRDAV